jgi:hypothetical protein
MHAPAHPDRAHRPDTVDCGRHATPRSLDDALAEERTQRSVRAQIAVRRASRSSGSHSEGANHVGRGAQEVWAGAPRMTFLERPRREA